MFNPHKTTTNVKLCNYSRQLSLLSNTCEHSRSLKAFNIYKEIFSDAPKCIKDTALLMFLRFHNEFYEYFDCPDSQTYDYFYDENGMSLDSLINQENKLLNKYGRTLTIFSHNDIFSHYLPGYAETLFHDIVRVEIQLFLRILGLKESLIYKHCWTEDCTDYIETQKEILILSEHYIQNYKFMKNIVNEEYYEHLISFTLGKKYYIDGYLRGFGIDYSDFHINEENFHEIYSNFIIENPNSKTTWFINRLVNTLENASKEKKTELFTFLLEQKCFDNKEYTCECKETFFNYNKFHENINDIFSCFEAK